MKKMKNQKQKNELTIEDKIIITGIGIIVIICSIWLVELFKYNPAIM